MDHTPSKAAEQRDVSRQLDEYSGTLIDKLWAYYEELIFFTRLASLGLNHVFEPAAMCQSQASMEGKTVIVTGATSGIGLKTAKELARRKARVILACRNVEKANSIAQKIQDDTKQAVVVKKLVLNSFESVRSFCEDINRTEPRLDVLINNAGMVNISRDIVLTKDGYEDCMQANHLSPVLISLLLLEKLKKSAPSRIINVSSDSHTIGSVSCFEARARGRNLRIRTPMAIYASTKLAMCLFTIGLAERLKGTGVTVNSLHPGLVRTPIASHGSLAPKVVFYTAAYLKGKSSFEGAQTTIRLAVDPSLEETTGEYFDECAPAAERYRNPQLKDRALVEEVFRVSLKLVNFDEKQLNSIVCAQ
ncbi:retinol dehydrogenase 12-like [Haemaphysalis longicornis]